MNHVDPVRARAAEYGQYMCCTTGLLFRDTSVLAFLWPVLLAGGTGRQVRGLCECWISITVLFLF